MKNKHILVQFVKCRGRRFGKKLFIYNSKTKFISPINTQVGGFLFTVVVEFICHYTQLLLLNLGFNLPLISGNFVGLVYGCRFICVLAGP